MKVLAFDRRPGSGLLSATDIDIFPDCSIIKDGKPFFVPPFATVWSYRLGLAFRNGRLGKNVGEKFAPRYLDAMAPCVITRPDDAIAAAAGLQHGLLNCYEGAVMLGDWMPVASPDAPLYIEMEGVPPVDLAGEIATAYRLFAAASAVSVMKIGDIVVTCREEAASCLPLDTHVKVSLNGAPALHFRIK